MDPSSVSDIGFSGEFGYASNKHLNNWIVENDTHNEQIQNFLYDTDRQYSSKQKLVTDRKKELGDIYDSIERTFDKRDEIDQVYGINWDEDYLSNETDPLIKLAN